MKWLLILAILIGSLLFIDSPNNIDSRIITQVWNSGHFLLFTGLVFLVLKSTSIGTKQPSFLIFATILFCIGVGLITELLQLLIGRNFEFKDILNDLIGGLAGFSAFQFLQHKSRAVGLVSLLMFIIFTLLGVRLLIVALIDDRLMKNDFPALSSFETPFELSRWGSHLANLSLSREIKQSGMQSMQVNLFPGKYPGITLNHFMGNWQGYDQLQFSIFNKYNKQFVINIKIFDAAHPASGYQYSDRFNSKTTVLPGWNQMQYSLNTIRDHPKSRPMDLSSVVSFSLFLGSTDKPMTIY